MKSTIKEYVRNFHICKRNKVEHLWPMGLLQSIPILNQVWSDISMDFIEGLLMSGEYNYVMMIVGIFNKYAHFLGMKYLFTSSQVVEIFIKDFIRLYKIPSSIITD